MAPVAVPSADQTVELLGKMALETQNKASDGSEAVKKQSDQNCGSLYKGNVANGQVPSYERSTTPMPQDYIDPSLCYSVNGYPFFYGAYDGISPDGQDYLRYLNAEGVDVPAGVYGDNGSMMYHYGYGYTPFPYSPATSPGPTMDGQVYAPQQYQYPASYFPSPASNGATVTPDSNAAKHGDIKEVSADQKQKPLSLETANGGALKGNNGQVPAKSTQSNSVFNAEGSLENGRGHLSGGFPSSGHQDPRFGFDSSRLPLWSDGPVTSSVNSSVPNGSAMPRNQILRPQNHLMARPMSGTGANNGFMNRIFTNTVRSGYGYPSNGYDSRTNGRGWLSMDAKYRPRGRGNGFYGYGNENSNGLNELNRGPRNKIRNTKGFTPIASVAKDQNEPAIATICEEKDKLSGSPVMEQYNLADFPVDYADAKFFIIKSYSEDDVHKSIKYNVWASTPNGNKKLDAAYQQAKEKSDSCPVFLFFSVNASGQFVGLAEMASSVDFDKTLEYWQQDKWNGCFSLKWHIVKDLPNTLLKHIILENNENKPVTNSRDTQEVKLEQGLQMLKIFKDHSSRTSILDDFGFYEARQKAIQENKVRLQFQKQVWEGKNGDVKNQDGAKRENKVPHQLEAVPVVHGNGNVKTDENGSVAKTGDGPKVV
uniref:YTH domain-containing family protein n=1 Tax=Kalanchoe fedtschenkoi TaxID=63787 RepID=A0A7N0UNH8_KALFE